MSEFGVGLIVGASIGVLAGHTLYLLTLMIMRLLIGRIIDEIKQEAQDE